MKISISVRTGKKENKIMENNGKMNVELKERAEKGKANIALIKIIAKHFNVSSSDVRIIKGLASHNKIVEVK
jgi:uncharacterized protein YggU (UPF0235/DUF167 family)